MIGMCLVVSILLTIEVETNKLVIDKKKANQQRISSFLGGRLDGLEHDLRNNRRRFLTLIMFTDRRRSSSVFGRFRINNQLGLLGDRGWLAILIILGGRLGGASFLQVRRHCL